MDLQHALFSPDGRIGRQEFWVGWLVLFAGGWVIHLLPVIGSLIWLASIYCWTVLYAKRLHDFGRSGWWAVIPLASNVIGFLLLMAAIVVAVVALATGRTVYGDLDGAWPLGPVLGGVFGVISILSVLFLVHLVFLLWVGMTPGSPGRNHYGDPRTDDRTSPMRPYSPPPPQGIVP